MGNSCWLCPITPLYLHEFIIFTVLFQFQNFVQFSGSYITSEELGKHIETLMQANCCSVFCKTCSIVSRGSCTYKYCSCGVKAPGSYITNFAQVEEIICCLILMKTRKCIKFIKDELDISLDIFRPRGKICCLYHGLNWQLGQLMVHTGDGGEEVSF